MAAIALLSCAFALAQEKPEQGGGSSTQQTQTAGSANKPSVTVPAGTKIFLSLVRYFSIKSAKQGDAIYLQIVFPVASEGKMLIPAGTYMQGIVQSVSRRQAAKEPLVEVELQSANMIFANGYTVAVALPAGAPGTAKPGVPAQQKAAPPKTYAEVTNDGVVIREGSDPDAGLDSSPSAPATTLSVVFHARGYNDLLDGNAPADVTLPRALVLDAERTEQASRLQAAHHPVLKPLPPKMCYDPGSGGTADTVIPGSPGTPPVVISGYDGATTIIPGTPPTPPTIIPGSPGTAGSYYRCP